ncbi:DUF3575 domain-containing protein [Chryseobacterium culicis]|uniref:DUF3575 domain-containing protein n=1 Tax=Chryseobacterium culicis TaxID=680127 RepID=A0A1H6IJM4_CHRCI|nr:DUF3575 domain-containing protein [Chryseobacterium culicis]SEH49062.1 Protein of unknown function [Chryseobacterium culicis]
MRKIIFLGAITLFATINGQQKNSIKVDPLSIIVGGGASLISYERVISNHSTVGIGTGFATFKVDDYKYNYIGANIFYRYYFKEALNGFYLTGSTGFGGGRAKYTADKKKLKNTYTMLDVTARLGYQWVWKSGFTLDLNAGAHFMAISYKEDNFSKNPVKAEEAAILPNIGVGLGYSF